MNVEGVLKWIAAAQTLLERYPILKTTNSLTEGILGNKSAFSFMLCMLRMLGITEEEILNWICNMLGDESEKGLLNILEVAIKGVMITTVADFYGCDFNPIITKNDVLTPKTIPVAWVDIMNTLRYAPKSINGQRYYLDAQKLIERDISPKHSLDFDAYLWYVINYGNASWGNRNRIPDWYDITENQRNNGKENKTYFTCGYDAASDAFNVQIPGNYTGKTIFEYNTDLIWSLNLFNSKTLVAKIMTSIIGNITNNTQLNIDLESSFIEKKISYLVQKILENEDITTIDDSFYKFSNEKFEEMLNESIDKQMGLQKIGDVEVTFDDDMLSGLLSGISDENATFEENVTTLTRNFTTILESIVEDVEDLDGSTKWNMKSNIIWNFIKELIIQITLQALLSPKVMMVYAINYNMLPDKLMTNDSEENIELFKGAFNWERFITQYGNILLNMTKQIIALILQELFTIIIDALRALFSLLVEKLYLEKLKDYRELLINLAYLANLSYNQLTSPRGRLLIENVQYADIIPEITEPKKNEHD